MLEIQTKARQWGNSVGVVLPKDVVEAANIRADKDIRIFVQEKQTNLSKVFGSLEIRQPTQELLDEIRQGED